MYTSPVKHFYDLTPDVVMTSIEDLGFVLTGRYSQLNSYENRVFSVELEDLTPEKETELIVKFYRPGRWSTQAISEEHEFLFDLQKSGIPAIAPKIIRNSSIFHSHGMIGCLFPKAYGRIPQELDYSSLKQVGGLLARLHNVGAQKKAPYRPVLSPESYGDHALTVLENHIPFELKKKYLAVANEILNFLETHLDFKKYIRIHGDCHKGNLLRTDPVTGPKEFFFVDFDDFCMGPPVQDFWMLFSGDNEQQEQQALLDGYTEFRDFNLADFKLIPALRGLRTLYYSSWIALRWKDPSFPILFPDFTSYNYWVKELESLEKNLHLL